MNNSNSNGNDENQANEKEKFCACKVNLWSKRLKKKKRYISDNDNFGMLG